MFNKKNQAFDVKLDIVKIRAYYRTLLELIPYLLSKGHDYYFNLLPSTFVAKVVKVTTLIELSGIKIAAIMGCSCPVTAK